LNSVLGRQDGEVYKHMLEEVMIRNPINKEKVFPGVNQYFRPKL